MSVADTEGVWLVRVRVSASVVRSPVTDARGGGNSGRDGRGRDSTVVNRPRLLVTLFRVFCSRGCVFSAGLGSGGAHASARGGGDCFYVVWGCSSVSSVISKVSDHGCLPMSVRLTVVTELSVDRSTEGGRRSGWMSRLRILRHCVARLGASSRKKCQTKGRCSWGLIC